MDRYFTIWRDASGIYFDEFFEFHSACQECIDSMDLDDIKQEFSSCDIIKGNVINNNN